MAYDPVLYVIDKKTKQKRLIRLLRFEKDPKEMDLYFQKIPGERPFQNPNESPDLAINVTSGDLMRDAVERGKGNGINQKEPPTEPENTPPDQEPEETVPTEPASTHPGQELEPDLELPDYESMKMAELREIATQNGIEVPFGVKKTDLIAKLKSLPPKK